MGCCISKCKPKKHPIEEFSHVVQDKLVISQPQLLKTPKIPIPPSKKISPFPPSPTTSSTSSISSFTCSNTTSSYSSLSSGSSTSSFKDHRSFSNEFLHSCAKENPHIIQINSIKEHSQLVVPQIVRAMKLDSPAKKIATPPHQSITQRVHGSTRQKRVRSNSPTTITRQKSFRREPEKPDSPYFLPSRSTLRSPSPSRRFNNGDSGRVSSRITPKESCSKRMVGSKVINGATSIYSPLTKESFRAPPSPYTIPSHLHTSLMRNKETCIHRISSKIDEITVQEALAHQDGHDTPMEDVDNPLISLDCFIFL